MGDAILSISVLVQAWAATQSVRLALRQRHVGWVFLAIANVLMLARRGVTFLGILHSRGAADPVAEFIALLISLLMVVGLALLLRWTRREADPAESPDTVQSSALERLKRASILLALLALFGCAVLSYFAYTASRDAITARLLKGNLDLANMLETSVRSAPDQAAALKNMNQMWYTARSQYPDNYLCVIGADGKLLLNTRQPDQVGTSVGATRIPAAANLPQTVQALLDARADWVGRNRNAAGEQQIAAYSYSSNLNALVAVHLPESRVDEEIRAAALPWGAGIALIFVIILPVSFGLLHYVGTSAQKRAFQALRRQLESEQRYSLLMDNVKDHAFLLLDGEGHLIAWNPGAESLRGWKEEDIKGRHISWFYTREDVARKQPENDLAAAGKDGRLEIEGWRVRHDGSRFWASVTISFIRKIGERPCGYLVVVRDVTGRRKNEERLQRTQEVYRRAIAGAGAVPYDYDYATRTYPFMGEGIEALTGYRPEEFSGALWGQLIQESVMLGETSGLSRAEAARRILAGEFRHWRCDLRIRTRDAKTRWLSDSSVERFDETGQVVGSTGILQDITERKQSEESLRHSEERFRELAETIQEVFWVTDPARNRTLYVSPAYEKIWGQSCQNLYDDPRSWLKHVHSDDRERVTRTITTQQAEGHYDEEFRIVRPDGQVRWIRERAFPVRSAAGRIERLVGIARDVTERRQLEQQLRQSQKMEAIGQLAGGVAHDFNNILASILMQVELTAEAKDLPEIVREDLQQIRAAAERAARLTRQLLLFGRRQVMQPRELDLNEIVTSLTKMLQRIIGEDVRMQLNLHPAPLMTRADAGMLDQMLLNLAVNARDAMPGGGRLVIETASKVAEEHLPEIYTEVVAGRYVWLSVSDTGCGIPSEALPHIFEPFFTTKEPGKGTGLGLATVFGIVQQHHGWIQVQSEPGKGTSFQIFLPESAGKLAEDVRATQPAPRGGTETILLVEDDSSVRLLTRVVLERAGYRVLESPDGAEALKIAEQHQDSIKLLLTDIVMPEGVSGRDLAARLQARNPKLRVVFTSGYSADIGGRELCLQEGQNFIQKPSPPQQLLETVRQCLDS